MMPSARPGRHREAAGSAVFASTGVPFAKIVQGPHAHRKTAALGAALRPETRRQDLRAVQVVDHRPRAARQVARPRVLAGTARRRGGGSLGDDQIGERASGFGAPAPRGRRRPAGRRGPEGRRLVDQRGDPLAPPPSLAPPGDEFASAHAVDVPRRGAARPAGLGARPGRLAAVQPAAAILHGGLAARVAGTRPRPAARRQPEIPRRIAVLEPAGAPNSVISIANLHIMQN